MLNSSVRREIGPIYAGLAFGLCVFHWLLAGAIDRLASTFGWGYLLVVTEPVETVLWYCLLVCGLVFLGLLVASNARVAAFLSRWNPFSLLIDRAIQVFDNHINGNERRELVLICCMFAALILGCALFVGAIVLTR